MTSQSRGITFVVLLHCHTSVECTEAVVEAPSEFGVMSAPENSSGGIRGGGEGERLGDRGRGGAEGEAGRCVGGEGRGRLARKGSFSEEASSSSSSEFTSAWKDVKYF